MPIGLPIVLPIHSSVLSRTGLVWFGSVWLGEQPGLSVGGPAPNRLGLKCYLAWGGTRVVGGGERGNFMYLYHNFSLVNQKRMLEVFVHTNFSIRVFWERRDR